MNIKCLGLQARAPMKLVEGQFCESSLVYKLMLSRYYICDVI